MPFVFPRRLLANEIRVYATKVFVYERAISALKLCLVYNFGAMYVYFSLIELGRNIQTIILNGENTTFFPRPEQNWIVG